MAGNKLLQGGNKRFTRQIGHSLNVNSFHCEGHQNTNVSFHHHRLASHTVLDLLGAGIVYPHLLKHSPWCHAFKWQLPQHLRLRSGGLMITYHTVTCDRLDRLPHPDDVELTSESRKQ